MTSKHIKISHTGNFQSKCTISWTMLYLHINRISYHMQHMMCEVRFIKAWTFKLYRMLQFSGPYLVRVIGFRPFFDDMNSYPTNIHNLVVYHKPTSGRLATINHYNDLAHKVPYIVLTLTKSEIRNHELFGKNFIYISYKLIFLVPDIETIEFFAHNFL